MINMSILDDDDKVIGVAELQIENARLKKKLDDALQYKIWIEDELRSTSDNPFMNRSLSRITKMDRMYKIIYGDTPLCDTCDATTGFFLEIDRLYSAIMNRKWLLRILRWGNYYKRKLKL